MGICNFRQKQIPSNQSNKTSLTGSMNHYQNKNKKPSKNGKSPADHIQLKQYNNKNPSNNNNNNHQSSTSQLQQTLFNIYNSENDYFIDQSSSHNNIYDTSQQVEDSYQKYPYKCIGRIIACYFDLQIEKQIDLPFGTGCLLSQRVILTVAHNIYNKALKKTADQVFFQIEVQQPSTKKVNKHRINVQRYGINERYFDEKDSMSQYYDLAILILQPNKIVKPQMCLTLDLDFKYQKDIKQQLLLSGYPKDKNVDSERFIQYKGELNIIGERKNFLLYHYFMGGGYSGCPIMVRKLNKNGSNSIKVVGVHKGIIATKAYGVMLNFAQNQLVQFLKIFDQNNSKQNRLLMLNKYDQLFIQQQNKLKQDAEYFCLDKIRWSNKIIQNHDILYYINKDIGQNSFKKFFQKAEEKIKVHNDNQMILKNNTFKFIFNRFKHLKLNSQEQVYLLTIILQLFEVNAGLKNQQNEVYYCEDISKKLHNFQNKVYFKTKSYVLKQKIQYDDQLREQPLKLKQKILKLIDQGMVKQNKQTRIKQKNQREMAFYRNYYYFEKAKEYVDDRQTDQQMDDQQLFEKGKVMIQSNNLESALGYFKRYLKSKELSGDYKGVANALSWLGSVYLQMKDYNNAQSTYQECLGTVGLLYGQKSKTYGTALNNIGTVFKAQQHYKLALECFQQSIRIQQSINGQNTAQIAPTLSQIGQILLQLKDYQTALIIYNKSLELLQMKYGKNSIQTFQMLNDIGLVLKRMQRFDEALSYYSKCLQILKRTYNKKEVVSTALIYNNMACVYKDQGNIKQGTSYIKKAYDIYARVLGDQHPDTVNAKLDYQYFLQLKQ